MRKTKIICTIGPACGSESILEKLIISGMDVARINTSHSSKEDAKIRIIAIREISKKHGKNTAIMLDLQGPKIRIGRLENEIDLKDGQDIIFSVRHLDESRFDGARPGKSEYKGSQQAKLKVLAKIEKLRLLMLIMPIFLKT